MQFLKKKEKKSGQSFGCIWHLRCNEGLIISSPVVLVCMQKSEADFRFWLGKQILGSSTYFEKKKKSLEWQKLGGVTEQNTSHFNCFYNCLVNKVQETTACKKTVMIFIHDLLLESSLSVLSWESSWPQHLMKDFAISSSFLVLSS